jgi:hypothetical protein
MTSENDLREQRMFSAKATQGFRRIDTDGFATLKTVYLPRVNGLLVRLRAKLVLHLVLGIGYVDRRARRHLRGSPRTRHATNVGHELSVVVVFGVEQSRILSFLRLLKRKLKKMYKV